MLLLPWDLDPANLLSELCSRSPCSQNPMSCLLSQQDRGIVNPGTVPSLPKEATHLQQAYHQHVTRGLWLPGHPGPQCSESSAVLQGSQAVELNAGRGTCHHITPATRSHRDCCWFLTKALSFVTHEEAYLVMMGPAPPACCFPP